MFEVSFICSRLSEIFFFLFNAAFCSQKSLPLLLLSPLSFSDR